MGPPPHALTPPPFRARASCAHAQDYFGAEHFEKRPNGSTWFSSLGGRKDVVDEWYMTSQIGNRSLEFIAAAVAANTPFVAYLGKRGRREGVCSHAPLPTPPPPHPDPHARRSSRAALLC